MDYTAEKPHKLPEKAMKTLSYPLPEKEYFSKNIQESNLSLTELNLYQFVWSNRM